MSKTLDGVALIAIVKKEMDELSIFALRKSKRYKKLSTVLTIGLIISGVVYTVLTGNENCTGSIVAKVFAVLMMLFSASGDILKVDENQMGYMQVYLKTEDVKGEILLRLTEVDEYLRRVNDAVRLKLNIPAVPENLTRRSTIAMVNAIFREFKCLLLIPYTNETYQRIIRSEESSEPLLLKKLLDVQEPDINMDTVVVTEEMSPTPVAFPVLSHQNEDLQSTEWKYEYQ